MPFFNNNKDKDNLKLRAFYHRQGAFNSKASAFDYFFFVEGKTPDEAEKLANTIASCRGVPDIAPPAESWVDQLKRLIKQGNDIASENPKITEFVVGLVSGAAASLTGVVVGNKVSNENQAETKYEIDNSEPKEIEQLSNNETNPV